MTERQGGCLCGAIRFHFTGEPQFVAICHCTRCQRQGGAVFSTNVAVAEAQYFQVGATKVYVDKGESGLPVNRHFCGTCGSPIVSRPELMPGLVVIKVGTLDDYSGLTPTIEVYGAHAAAWFPPLPNARRFEAGLK